MKFPKQFFLFCFLVTIPNLARAEEELVPLSDMSLEELLNVPITTATKTAIKVDDAPGSVTVVTRQQIDDMNARTLRDILNVFVPGMDVVPTYFRYGDRVNEGIYSRGLLSDFSQQVLILYNGQGKFNESTWATPFPAVEFTLDNVESVEISRSPVPLHGSAAMTIINLITREQKLHNQAEGKVNIAASQYSTIKTGPQSKNVSAQWEHDIGDWRLSGSLQTYSDLGQPHPSTAGQGGYPYSPESLRDGTKGAQSYTLDLKSKDEKVALQSWYKNTNRDAFLSAGTPSPSNDLYKYQGSEWLTNLTLKPTDNLELILGYQTSYWGNFYPSYSTTPIAAGQASPTGGDESNFDEFIETDYTVKFTAAGDHSLLMGAKLEKEGQNQGSTYSWDTVDFIPAAPFAPNDSRVVSSVFAEDTWRVSRRVTLLGGARADHYLGFAGKSESLINPRIASTYEATPSLTLKFLFATVGRPPSIYEREGSLATPLKGSPNVNSEKLHTYEVSALYHKGAMKLQASPFYEQFVHKIEYVPNAANTIFTAQNNGTTISRGLDFDLWYYFTQRTYVFGNATFLKSRDITAVHDTYFLPKTYVNMGFNYGHEKWDYNINGYFRGKRTLSAAEPINTANASGTNLVVNASASYNFTKQMRLFFLVENLTNSYNYIPLSIDGLYVPERRITYNLGLNWEI